MYKKALLHLKTTDPILYEVAVKTKPFKILPHPNPYTRIIRSIIGQQLSVKAASTIYARLENLFPNKLIMPEILISIHDEDLRTCGVSYQKISYLKDLSQKVIAGEVQLSKLSEMDNEQVIEELVKIKGIGQWTAEMFLMFTLARVDVFSFGDLGLQNAIKRLYKLKNKPTVNEMEILSKNWSPYRTYAAMILWQSLDKTPK